MGEPTRRKRRRRRRPRMEKSKKLPSLRSWPRAKKRLALALPGSATIAGGSAAPADRENRGASTAEKRFAPERAADGRRPKKGAQQKVTRVTPLLKLPRKPPSLLKREPPRAQEAVLMP